MSFFEVFFSLMGSMFICSFSSVMSATILIFLTIGVVGKLYWMILSVIPLYLFSLFMLGGLYVLIGFVMMSDIRDLDMIFSGKGLMDFIFPFTCMSLIFFFSDKVNSFDFSSLDWSVVKTESKEIWGLFGSTYIFLMFFLLVFLYVMFMMTKGSWGGGGFVKNR